MLKVSNKRQQVMEMNFDNPAPESTCHIQKEKGTSKSFNG